MATPVLSTHVIDGALGPITIDVRAQSRTQPRPALLILHGFKGFKDWGMFPTFAERVARSGVTAITCNVSGSGVAGEQFAHPDRFARNTCTRELGDITAVIDALMAGGLGVAPPPRLGLLGHSRGGGLAILVAARDERVSALVTWAAISTVARWDAEIIAEWRRRGTLPDLNSRTGEVLHRHVEVLEDALTNAAGSLDIRAAAARMRCPWLLVHGTADEAVPLAEAEALLAVAPPATTTPLPVPGAGHTFGAVHPWRGSTPELDQTMESTIRWCLRAVG